VAHIQCVWARGLLVGVQVVLDDGLGSVSAFATVQMGVVVALSHIWGALHLSWGVLQSEYHPYIKNAPYVSSMGVREKKATTRRTAAPRHLIRPPCRKSKCTCVAMDFHHEPSVLTVCFLADLSPKMRGKCESPVTQSHAPEHVWNGSPGRSRTAPGRKAEREEPSSRASTFLTICGRPVVCRRGARVPTTVGVAPRDGRALSPAHLLCFPLTLPLRA